MIVKNSALLAMGEAVNRGGKILSLYVTALLLQKVMFGTYSFLISLSTPIMVALDFGLNSVILYRTSPSRYRRLTPFFILLKMIVLCAVCLILLGLQGAFHIIPVTYQEFIAFTVLCLGYDLQVFTSNGMRTGLDFTGDFWIKLACNCLFLVALVAILLLHGHLSVAMALWLQAGSFLIGGAWGMSRIFRMLAHWLPPRRHRSKGLKAVARISAPMAAASSAGVLQPSIDSIVLGGSRHFEANASFTLVNRMNQLAQLPVNILVFAGMPYLVEQLGGVRRDIDRKTLWSVISLLIILGAAIAQAFVLGIEWVIPRVLGRQYDDTAHYAAVLSLYVVPLYIYSLLLNLLCVMRNVVATQVIMAMGTILNLALDIWVVHSGHATQIMWVTVLGQWILMALFASYYRIRQDYWPFGPVQIFLILLATAALLLPWLSLGEANMMESLARLLSLAATLALGAFTLLRKKALVKQLLQQGRGGPATEGI